MAQSIEYLENALRSWESIQLVTELGAKLATHEGRKPGQGLSSPSVRHWRELRTHLLRVPHHGFDYSRFMSDEGLFKHFPVQLASWVNSSRRVFSLTDELMIRFASADYSRYTWADLLWPFDSFAIDLSSLIAITRDGRVDFSNFILVSSMRQLCPDYPYGEENGFEIGLFTCGESKNMNPVLYTDMGSSPDYNECPAHFLSPKDHDWLDENLRNKRWPKLYKRIKEIRAGIQQMGGSERFPPGCDAPTSLRKEDPINNSAPLMKIIAGLCLYLEALPRPVTDGHSWGQTPNIQAKRQVRNVITDGAKICEVMDFHTISPQTMSLFPETLEQGPAYTVTPHWRRAHYRRRRGQGHNPDAPRDVYVAPALIHKDQLPEDALPGGSLSSVK